MHAGNDVDAGSEPFLDQGASNLVGYIERRGGDIDGHVARTNALGVEELASRINDCFELLTGGRRTALPRHRTLRATLDWSYQLLPELERVVLRRLAIFAGCFTLQAASAVAASAEVAVADIVDCAANLVGKSLVAADLGGDGLVSAAGHDAGLRVRKARRERRAGRGRAPPRRISPRSGAYLMSRDKRGVSANFCSAS
jgi:hypothetical protein